MAKTKIDVFGSCVVRDIFRFGNAEQYQLCSVVARQSVPSLFAEPIKENINRIDWSGINNYEKRQLLINMRKTGLDLLENSNGEWIILDLAEDRFNLYQIPLKNGASKITKWPSMEMMKDQFQQKKVISDEIIEIDFDKILWKEVEQAYVQFASILKARYTQEKVIILEVKEATELVKNTLEIVPYNSQTSQRRNIYLNKVYRLLKKLLPQAHYIKMPTNTFMDENHIWGILPLHFQESYYRYAKEAVDNITKNKMTYSLEQLFNKQCQENAFYRKVLDNNNDKDKDKDIIMALGDIKEYRQEINRLQEEVQKLQLDNAKIIIKNNKPNGNINKSIIQLDKKMCTGCSACYSACPIKAIEMGEDENGFITPIVNTAKCRNCGYCSNVCPELNFRLKNSEKQVCLAVMAQNDVREISSSGGVFPILAEYILEKEGYVCGAAWNEKWEVEHKFIHTKDELYQLQESKYVQSNINDTYKKAKKLLETGKYVLFSGTPCQIDGLYHFLGKDYENLLTMDILCHGVPAQKMFKNYLETKYKGKPIKHIQFRDKKKGWGAYTTISFEDGHQITMNMQSCMWIMGYLRFYLNRDSCYNCKYTTKRRIGDFTVGDFWGIEKYYPTYNDKKGTSVVTLNNDKAIQIYNRIKDKFILKAWLPMDYSVEKNNTWIKNIAEPANRRRFLDYFKTENYCEALEQTIYGGTIFDVGIVGWWYYYNYGSILTYYALNRALLEMGYTSLMIHHTNNGEKMSRLTNAFPENFIKKHCSISHFYTDEDMRLLNTRCKAFISGSDQLWNPLCEDAAGKEFFLDFVDDEHLKLSYASSLGNSVTASDEFKRKYAPLAQRFDAVSVREETGIEGCKNIYGVNAVKVCDPVFLCEKEEFMKLAGNSGLELKNESYLLSFILDPDENKRKVIQEKAKELNLKYINLVDLTDAGEKAKRLGLENTKPFASVEDFMNYFVHASYIITDSFHGTCFSIIHNKEFISIANYGRGEKRVGELLKWLGVEGRIMYSTEKSVTEFVPKPINYDVVNKRIYEARKSARDWLEKYLKKIKNND